MDKIIAKMQVASVTIDQYSETPKFQAVYTGTPEDNLTFTEAAE